MMPRKTIAIAAVVVLAAISTFALRRAAAAPPRQIPTARVQRGRVQVTVYTNGELRAARTTQLFTPAMGGPLQIVRLAESGAAVKSGDTVVEFDPAEQTFNLEQARFDLRQAEQDIVKAEAQAAVQGAEDDEALLRARFDVRRAELLVSANELKGAIEAQQNVLLLEEARHQFSQIERDAQRHRETNLAATNVLREKRNKAQLAVQVAEHNIENLQIRAPFDGFVMLRQNMQAFGGIVLQPSAMPEYRVGDAANSGQAIADLIDNSHVEVIAKLPEQDRANVAAGQAVDVFVDTLPDVKLHGSVRAVSGVASRQIWDIGTRQFDVTFDVTGGTLRMHPGITAAVAIAGPAFDNALHVPRSAVFDVAGKPTVYVRTHDGFEAHEVLVRARTDSLAVIENVDPGAEVALVNPTQSRGPRPARSGPGPVTQRASR
jgi:multidrug resistance efflux pump